MLRDLNESLGKDQYQNYGTEQMNEEFAQLVKKGFGKYNNYFLTSYLGFKPTEINEIESILIEHLRTEWQSQRKPSQTLNFEQRPGYQQTVTGEQQVASQNPLTDEDLAQTHVEQLSDPSQMPENNGVEPLNHPDYYGLSNNAQSIPNNQRENPTNYERGTRFDGTYSSSQLSSGYGSSYQQPSKHRQLPDSSSFISGELDNQKSQSVMNFSPTLNKVLAEDQGKGTNSLENNNSPQNHPGNVPQQSENSLSPSGVGRVTLNKSIGTSYGLPNQGQFLSEPSLSQAEQTADEIIEKLKQKQTKPIAQVVEREQITFTGHTNAQENSRYGLGQRPLATNNLGTNYNSIDSSSLFSHHGDDFYESNTGIQKLQPIGTTYNQGTDSEGTGIQKLQPIGTTYNQRTNYNRADSSLLLSQHGDNFYEGKYNSGNHNIEPIVGLTNQPSNSNPTNYGSLFSQHNDNFYQGELHYGSQHVGAPGVFETTGNIAPLEIGQANVVVHPESLRPSKSYAGVKGRIRPTTARVEPVRQTQEAISAPSSSTFQPDLDSGIQEELTTPVSQEVAPWYTRWGNKIKQTASDLKSKIVG